MKAGLVAFHYPSDAHRAEFIARVQLAAEIMRPTPGCVSADCWVTEDAVISTAQWESDDARASSFAIARAAGVDFDEDDREIRPRKILHLESPR